MIRLVALSGVLAISFTSVLVRAADVSLLTAAFFRAAYALPVLAMLWQTRKTSDLRPRRDRWIAFAAGLLLAADLWLFHAAIGAIGAGLGTLLANTQVVFVALAAWALHGERPSATALVAVPVVFGGMTLLSGLGVPGTYGEDPVLGVTLGAIASLFYASFILTYRVAGRSQTSAVGALLDVTLGTAAGALAAGIATGTLDFLPTWPAHGWLLTLALLAQVFGWLMIGFALPRLPALTTSVLILIQPVGALIWGALVFSERLSMIQAGGVLVVLAGVAATTLRGSVRQAIPGSPSRAATGR